MVGPTGSSSIRVAEEAKLIPTTQHKNQRSDLSPTHGTHVRRTSER